MNAQQAKEMTEANKKGPAIQKFLNHVHDRIFKAANQGESTITHPMHGSTFPYPTREQYDALWAALTADGYTVEHHPGPNPEIPCSGPYTTISWK